MFYRSRNEAGAGFFLPQLHRKKFTPVPILCPPPQDFVALNVLGFGCLATYDTAIFFSTTLQAEFTEANHA